jgi:hypothetical protein
MNFYFPLFLYTVYRAQSLQVKRPKLTVTQMCATGKSQDFQDFRHQINTVSRYQHTNRRLYRASNAGEESKPSNCKFLCLTALETLAAAYAYSKCIIVQENELDPYNAAIC